MHSLAQLLYTNSTLACIQQYGDTNAHTQYHILIIGIIIIIIIVLIIMIINIAFEYLS